MILFPCFDVDHAKVYVLENSLNRKFFFPSIVAFLIIVIEIFLDSQFF